MPCADFTCLNLVRILLLQNCNRFGKFLITCDYGNLKCILYYGIVTKRIDKEKELLIKFGDVMS